jgi:hypothetical protein
MMDIQEIVAQVDGAFASQQPLLLPLTLQHINNKISNSKILSSVHSLHWHSNVPLSLLQMSALISVERSTLHLFSSYRQVK